jgi:hypothetical protein
MTIAAQPIHAIPTVYSGVRFRSRLEARWAAFFDVVGWDWSYETLDFRGWEPDFKLATSGELLLIEVKPAASFEDAFGQEAKRDIERCLYRQPYRALILGLEPVVIGGLAYVGWTYEMDGEDFAWDRAAIGSIAGDQLCVCHSSRSHRCLICGADEGWTASMHPDELRACWAKACNLTQWKPRL